MAMHRISIYVSRIYAWAVVPLMVFIIPVFSLSSAFADESFIARASQGRALMESGRYHEAVRVFDELYTDDLIIADFVLLWRAESHFREGKMDKALADIKTIKRLYRDTAAYRNAMRLEIEMRKVRSDDASMAVLYENYLSSFPGDDEIRLEYALALKERGDKDKAGDILKALYIDAGEYADRAGTFFDTGTLSLEESLNRGNGLIKQWRFVKAKLEFVRALSMAPADMKSEIDEKIAYCTFRQKDYIASARLYSALNDMFMAAVSFLRSGQKRSYLRALETLKEMKDPRTGLLIVALAGEMRRRGDPSGAVAILRRELGKFPFDEEMRWQIGWTHYLVKEYDRAEEVFRGLNKRYDASRYRYWMLKSGERLGRPVTEEFAGLCGNHDYYGFLGCLKSGTDFKKISPVSVETAADSPLLKRFSALKKLDLREEAHFELKRLIKSLRKTREIILYSRKLQEIGEYKKAISVATMVPYSEEVHELFYPIAYWDVIREAGKRYSVDPVYILSIAREESRLDPEARSVAGALGLMQLMPRTAERLCRKIGWTAPEEEPYYDVETNIVLGTYYLRSLIDRFRSIPAATAAYNAGENVVKKWLDRYDYEETDEFIEDIPYPETRRYVKKVLTSLYQYSKSLGKTHEYEGIFRKASLEMY